MLYIDDTLEDDEVVLYRGSYHWLWNLRSFGLLNAFNHILITDHRILKKSGILNVRVEAMFFGQLESTEVAQSLWGRLFGYGDLFIHGAGGKFLNFANLAAPGTVNRQIGRAAALYQGRYPRSASADSASAKENQL